jgi:hypothetical protein
MGDERFKIENFQKDRDEVEENLAEFYRGPNRVITKVPDWKAEGLTEILLETERIYSGTCRFLNYGIQQAGLTVPTALNRLQVDFTHNNVESFLEMVQQDFGLRIRKYFEYLLKGGDKDEYED